MSERRTAAWWREWAKQHGVTPSVMRIHDLIDDLAATEAKVKALREELVLANNTVTDCEQRMSEMTEQLADYRAYYEVREGLPDGTWREASQARRELETIITRIEARRSK
jgi:phage shock protein A